MNNNISIREMSYNKSNLLYKVVFREIEYVPPFSSTDYDSIYKIISPFILNKQLFETGIKSHISSTQNCNIFKSEINDTIKTDIHEQITVSFNEIPLCENNQPLLQPSLPLPSYSIQPSLPLPSSPINSHISKFIPPSNHTDSLFWNIYIAINGIQEYNSLNGKYSNYISDEKQKIVNKFSSQISLKNNDIKCFMKKNKITGVSMKEMLSDILSNESISFKDVLLYAQYYKVNIIFVNHDKRIYFKVEYEKDSDIEKNIEPKDIYIEFSLKQQSLNTKNTPKTYKYILISSDSDIYKTKSMIENYYRVESLTKPLKNITSYKIDDLKTIMVKLNIEPDSDSKFKKNDLYKMIDERINQLL